MDDDWVAEHDVQFGGAEGVLTLRLAPGPTGPLISREARLRCGRLEGVVLGFFDFGPAAIREELRELLQRWHLELQRRSDSCAGDTGARYRGGSGAAGFAKRRGSQRSIYHFGIFSGGFCDGKFLADDVEECYFQQIDGALTELGLRPCWRRAGCDF